MNDDMTIIPFALEDLINRVDLESILSNFSSVTGLSSGVVRMHPKYEKLVDFTDTDFERHLMTINPEQDRLTKVTNNSKFCQLIRNSQKGNLRCWCSDLKYSTEAFEAGHPILYRCHVGLVDVVAPIRIGSWHVANVYFGQIQCDFDEAELNNYFSKYITRLRPLESILKRNINETKFKKIKRDLSLNNSLTYHHFSKLIAQLPYNHKGNISEVLSAITLLEHIADLISQRASSQAIMQVMRDIDKETGITLDINNGLQIFLRNAKRLIRFECSSIWLLEQPEGSMKLSSVDCPYGFTLHNNCAISATLIEKVTKTKKTFFSDSSQDVDCLLAHCNLHARCAVPLLVGDRLIGVWTIGSEQKRTLNLDTGILLETLAAHAALFAKSVRDRNNIVEIMSKYEKDDLLQIVVEKVPEMIYGKGCSIFLKEEQGDRAYLAASKGLPKELVGKAYYEPGEGLTGWVLKNGKILNIRIHRDRETREKTIKSIAPDLSWKSKFREYATDSTDVAERPFLAAPLKTKDGRILGVIRISIRTEEGDFSIEDEILLSACADQIVAALERMRITTDLKHRIEQLKLLSDISAELLKEGNLNTILNKIAEKASEVLQCKGITIWLRDEEKTRIILRAAFGPHKKYIGDHNYKIGEGLTGGVAQTGNPVWVKQACTQPKWKGKYNQIFGEDPPGKIPLIILPLVVEDDTIGVVKFTRRTIFEIPFDKLPEFTENEYNLAWVLSRQISFVINNANMLENLKEQIKQLETAQEKIVKERENAWKEFSAITAHRIGTEVADLGGALYWLKQLSAAEKEKFALYMKRIDEALTRMKMYVSAVTEFAKPPALIFESINVNELLSALTHESNLESIEFVLDLDDNIPNILGDKENLIYAFKELCHNAQKALVNHGTITIKTDLDRLSNQISIHFIDNGSGISPKYKDKIFEIGFRRRSGGTGLGLAIVKRYIELHKGTIEEIGEESKGAHFFIQLPLNPQTRI